jgi:hypothetical protein
MKLRCDYRWPLLEPNEEDKANDVSHWCRLEPEHDDEHLCACGARPLKCPACDVELPEDDLIGQVAHMTAFHPDIIETRRAESARWDGWEE